MDVRKSGTEVFHLFFITKNGVQDNISWRDCINPGEKAMQLKWKLLRGFLLRNKWKSSGPKIPSKNVRPVRVSTLMRILDFMLIMWFISKNCWRISSSWSLLQKSKTLMRALSPTWIHFQKDSRRKITNGKTNGNNIIGQMRNCNGYAGLVI